MLRFFVAGNLWLFVAYYCYIERLRGSGLSRDAMTVPSILAFICFALYCYTSSALPFRFSVRALLMGMVFVAVPLGIFLFMLN
jgi:hypothetical protein